MIAVWTPVLSWSFCITWNMSSLSYGSHWQWRKSHFWSFIPLFTLRSNKFYLPSACSPPLTLTVYKATSLVCGRDQRLAKLNPIQAVFLTQVSFLLLTERTKIKRCNSVPTVVRTSKPGWVSVENILTLEKKNQKNFLLIRFFVSAFCLVYF